MVVYGEITTGAESDLKQATSLARRMVGLWGMSDEVGPVYLGTGEEHVFLGREIVQDKSFSDATSERLDAAVREMVENALQQALVINRAHRDKLDGLVKALMERETLDAPRYSRSSVRRQWRTTRKPGWNFRVWRKVRGSTTVSNGSEEPAS